MADSLLETNLQSNLTSSPPEKMPATAPALGRESENSASEDKDQHILDSAATTTPNEKHLKPRRPAPESEIAYTALILALAPCLLGMSASFYWGYCNRPFNQLFFSLIMLFVHEHNIIYDPRRRKRLRPLMQALLVAFSWRIWGQLLYDLWMIEIRQADASLGHACSEWCCREPFEGWNHLVNFANSVAGIFAGVPIQH